MTLLNPANAALTALTFTVAATGTSTDALGNTIPGSGSVKVNAIVTKMGLERLGLVQQSLGVERAGIPVKVRVQNATGQFPAALPRGKVLEATCTYAGQPARVSLIIGAPSGAVEGVGLLPALGHSVDGLLCFVG